MYFSYEVFRIHQSFHCLIEKYSLIFIDKDNIKIIDMYYKNVYQL